MKNSGLSVEQFSVWVKHYYAVRFLSFGSSSAHFLDFKLDSAQNDSTLQAKRPRGYGTRTIQRRCRQELGLGVSPSRLRPSAGISCCRKRIQRQMLPYEEDHKTTFPTRWYRRARSRHHDTTLPHISQWSSQAERW